MKNQYLPFVSVVVCTLNRYEYLVSCIKSLRDQEYPMDHYEIIVVDDGSTDATKEMAVPEGVRLIHHKVNRGLPSARNTGIAAAKGEIVAFIDDDAVADPHWLTYLVQPFSDPKVSASGGQTFPYKTNRLMERYLTADQYGNPPLLAFGQSKNPLWRFYIYLKNTFAPVNMTDQPTEVQAVFGLNCAYRVTALKEFGGFDETLFAEEDSELSTRFRSQGAHIIFIPSAIIYHRHRENLFKLIRQTYYRAESTVHYYAKEKKILPIFPLPLLYILLSLSLLFLWPIWGIVFLLIGPIILYVWWPLKAFSKHHPEYFIYAYIQLSLELASLLGLVRGIFRKKRL
jgi:GT2 family glycosyltransferase